MDPFEKAVVTLALSFVTGSSSLQMRDEVARSLYIYCLQCFVGSKVYKINIISRPDHVMFDSVAKETKNNYDRGEIGRAHV